MMAILLALVALVILLGTTATWFGRAKRVAIPVNRSGFLLAWGMAVVAGIGSFMLSDSGWLSGLVGGFSALGGVALLVLMALGGQRAEQAIAVGDHMPIFQGIDDQNQTFDAAVLEGKPVLLKFFRGHW